MGTGTRSAPTTSVTITRSDGVYVATDEETGVASHGDTKSEALENLAEALRLRERPDPDDAPDDIDPSDAPWF